MGRSTVLATTFTAKLSRASATATSGTARVLSAWLDTGVRVQEARPLADDRRWSGAHQRAILVYDTSEHALPTGIRAVVKEGVRRLLYAVDELEVLLRVGAAAAPDRYELVGQVLDEGVPAPGVPVRLAGATTSAATDRAGAFRMADLPAGPCSLEISVNDVVLDVAPFDLK